MSCCIRLYAINALRKYKVVDSVTVLKLTQITDLHLGPTPDFKCRNIATFKTLQSVLAAINNDARGDDRLLLTGDIASDGQPEAYRQLDRLLSSKKKCVLWLPGNHDHMAIMQKNLTHFPFTPVYDHGDWAIIMLDSSLPNHPGGKISIAEMQRLEQHLTDKADKNILVAMHHSPVAVESLWVDQHRIANHHQLFQLLASHGKVRAVINGHIHQQHEFDWNGIPVYSAPSTCFQFKPKSTDFALDDQPPAYRWIDLHADGKLETGVKFLPSLCVGG